MCLDLNFGRCCLLRLGMGSWCGLLFWSLRLKLKCLLGLWWRYILGYRLVCWLWLSLEFGLECGFTFRLLLLGVGLRMDSQLGLW